jgi:hypothetical protein
VTVTALILFFCYFLSLAVFIAPSILNVQHLTDIAAASLISLTYIQVMENEVKIERILILLIEQFFKENQLHLYTGFLPE